jgi:hypothetical protein
MAVQGVVGGIQVQPDRGPRRGRAPGKQFAISQSIAPGVATIVLSRNAASAYQGVSSRATARRNRQRLAAILRAYPLQSGRSALAHQHRQDPVQAQPLVIFEMLVAERETRLASMSVNRLRLAGFATCSLSGWKVQVLAGA